AVATPSPRAAAAGVESTIRRPDEATPADLASSARDPAPHRSAIPPTPPPPYCPSTARLCLPRSAICVRSLRVPTATGLGLLPLFLVPLPSSPISLAPQSFKAPFR